MKAVVLETNKKYAAVLNSDGTITKIINRNYNVGQVIIIKKNRYAKIAAIAAAFVLLFSISAYSYFAPYTYVSIDVNPSIEFSVNRFDRVISVKAVNDDGSEILSKAVVSKVNHKNITDAVIQTLKEVKEKGYFEDESQIVIATSNSNEEKALSLAKKIQKEALKEVDDTVTVETISVGLGRVKQAKEIGITPGKLNLIEKLKEVSGNPEFDIKDWVDKSVKEIIKTTNELKKVEDEKEKEKSDLIDEGTVVINEYEKSEKEIEKEKEKLEKELEKEQKEKEKEIDKIIKDKKLSEEEKEQLIQEIEEKYEETQSDKEQKKKELEEKKAEKEKEKEEKKKEIEEKLKEKEKEKEEKKKEIEEKNKNKDKDKDKENNGKK